MVAVVSGAGLGMFGSSVAALGGIGATGNAGVGRGNDRVFVNTATGNLIVQSQDERLSALGLDFSLVRTYNSQGLLNDDNGDNWRLNVHQRLYDLPDPVNTPGSTITKVFGDGREVTYRYDQSRAAYVSSEGAAAHDTLEFSGGGWTWTEGSTQVEETYDADGWLTSTRDADGNTIAYQYTDGRLSQITDASGQITRLVYTGINLTGIEVLSDGVTQTLTTYGYDSSDRLTDVTVDLTPANAADSLVYTTSYTYDGSSRRIASITQTDGSSVAFTYELINGQHRVSSYTDGEGRISYVDYALPSGGGIPVQVNVDESQLTTTQINQYALNAAALTGLGGWQPADLLEFDHADASAPKIEFDAAGNGFAVWAQGSDILIRRYTASTGTWGAAVTLDARTEDAFQPLLAIDRDSGDAVVAWVQGDGTANSLYTRRFDAGTSTWGTTQLLESAGGDVSQWPENSSISIAGDHVAVAWVQNDGTANSLYLSRLVNGAWTAPLLIDNSSEVVRQPQVAIDQDGNATLLWRQYVDTDFEQRIHTRRWDNTTQTLSGISQLDAEGDRYPRLKFDAQGNGFAVWGGGVNVRRYDAATGQWGPQVILTEESWGGELAFDANGDALLAWAQPDGATISVYASRYDASTGAWGAAEVIENTALPVNLDNALTLSLANGEGVVAWAVESGTSADIYAVRLSGGVWGPPTLLESREEGAGELQSAIDAAGNATIVWVQADGWAPSIYQARYVGAYYTVPSGATWQSLANTLYGINSAAAGSALQAALGSPPLTTGQQLTGLPATLNVTTTVPGYYVVESGDTWASITQALYGTSDAAAISALQAALFHPSLTVGASLSVPATLSYSSTGEGAAVYLQTDVTDALGVVTRYEQDVEGRLAAVTTAPGGLNLRTEYAYDVDGNVTAIIEDPDGLHRVTTLEYDGNGNLLRRRDAVGNTVERTYNGNNQLLSETRYQVRDPDGAGSGQPSAPLTTRYVYDSENHLRFEISADGRVIEHQYRNDGVRLLTFSYSGALYTATPHALADLISWANARDKSAGERVDYAYDFRGNVNTVTTWSATNASGAGNGIPSVTRFVYDQRGQLLQTIEARGSAATPGPTNPDPATAYATTFVYDGLGRVLSTTKWNSATSLTTTLNAYDDANRRTATTFANGLVTTSTYNRRGELTSVANGVVGTPASLGSTTYTYDASGRLRSVTDPSLIKQFFLYDDAGRQVGQIDGDGSLTEFVYDDAGQQIKTIQFAATLSAASLNALAAGSDVAWTTLRSEAGGIANVAARITRKVYDLAGQLVFTIDAAGAVSKSIYDGAGRLTDTIRYATPFAIPATTDQVLPAAVTVATSIDDRRTRNFYDGEGHLIGRLDGEGYLTEYYYDAAGRLTQQTARANQSDAALRAAGTLADLKMSVGQDDETTPDPERDITTYFLYDGQGRQVGELDGEGYLTETVYDVSGNVSQLIRYDRLLTYVAGASTLATLKLAAAGAPTQTHSYQYDGASRVTQETNYEGTIATYAYDAVGNLVATTKAHGTAEARTTEARYDFLGRVTQELTAAGRALITGGMTQVQINDIWSRYGTTYTYDLAGRRQSATQRPNDTQTNTTRYFYDVDHRLRFTVNALGEVTEHRYSALGQLTETRVYTDRISTADLVGGEITSALTSRVATAALSNSFALSTFSYTLTGRLSRSSTATSSNSQQDVRTDVFYNAFGEERLRIDQIDEGDGARTLNRTQQFDRRGLLTATQWQPATLVTTEARQYDAFGRLSQVTDARGGVSRIEYDRLGREVATVDALGGRRPTTYDAFSRTLTTRDAQLNLTTYSYDDVARSSTLTTHLGITVVTTHNEHGQVLSVVANGNTTTYDYDANGQLQSVSDDLGPLESRTYDRAGRQVTQTDARGVVTTMSYDAANRVLTRTVDAGVGGLALVTTYVYDGQGRVERVEEPSGRVTVTSYDRAGRVTQLAVDPAGANLRTSYAYDRAGRVITVTEGFGGVVATPRRTQYFYDALGRRLEEVIDPIALGGTLNLRTQYKYDANGNVTRKIDANDHSTWYVYDADNRLTHTIDALGSVTRNTYDADGRVMATRLYAAPVVTTGFPDVVTSVSPTANDTLDRVVQSVYDQDGRARFTIDAVGTVTERTFDADGNITRTRVYANAIANGSYTTTAAVTDALAAAQNNPAALSPNDHVQWTAFDARGDARFTIDAAGAVVGFVRDAAGNVISTTAYATLRATSEPTGLTALEEWAAQALVSGHADNRTVKYWYDGLDRQVFKLDAEGYLTETRYNDALRTTSTILYRDRPNIAAGATTAQVRQSSVVANFNAARDQTSTSETDAAGRTSRIYDALTASAASSYEEFRYDELSNRVNVTDPRGVELAERNSSWAQAERTRLGYSTDAASLTATERQLLRNRYTTIRAYDAAGREVSVTDPLGGITRNAYDAAGNLVKITDPRNNVAFRYYDAAGRLRFQVDPLGYVTELRYDALGNVVDEFSYANALTGSYDETTTLQQLENLIVEDAVRDRQLVKTHDRRGLVRTITHHAAPSSYTEEYEYDAFGQKRLYRDKNQAVFEYRYNARGELTREILPEVEVVTGVLPNVTTQLLRLENHFEYTAFGEQSLRQEASGTSQQRQTRYFYDHRGLQTRVELPSFAVYSRETNVTTTQTPVVQKSYDGAGNLVLEIAANGGRMVNYYDSRNLLVASVDADNVLREFSHDAVGNLISERAYDTRLAGVQSPATRPVPINPDGYRELRHQYNANNLRVGTQTRSETQFSYALLQATGQGYYDAVVATIADYDANGNVVRTVDGNGYATFSYYDARGNRTLQVDAAGYVIRWEYNAQGQLRLETKYAGQLSASVRNSLSAATPVQSILGAIPAGDDRATEYEYDQLGRVVVERKLAVTYSSVDASNGSLTSITSNLETRFEYDGNGNLTAEIRPGAHGRIDHDYDALGRKTGQSDPQFLAFGGHGQPLVLTREETRWQYDAYGNVAVQTEFALNAADNREQRFHYDTSGNLRIERDALGVEISREYSIAGDVLRVSREVTDVNGVMHAYRTHHSYDVLGREISRQEIEDEGAPGQVIRETQDTRYNSHGDIEAKGINGQYQEKYLYDRLGRLFWTNQENGTPRLYLYDANGNAVVELHAINSDLTMVDGGSGLRPVMGPADVRLFSPLGVQLTFSIYDRRNRLTDVFQPPMEFGELISNPPTVTTSGTQGPPPETLSDLAAHLPTGLTFTSGQTQTLPPAQSTTIANNPSSTTGFGYRADEHWSQNVGIPLSELGLQAGTTTANDPPVRQTLSDVISGGGTVRTVTERVTKRSVATTVTVQPDNSVLKEVTTTIDVITRITVFTRSCSVVYGPDEQSIDQQWTLDRDETVTTNRSVDTKRERFTRTRSYDATMAYNYSAATYPGTTSFVPGATINVGYQIVWEWDVMIDVNIPAFDAWGAGPTTVVVERTDGVGRIERQFNGASGVQTFYYPMYVGASFSVSIYKGGRLIGSTVVSGMGDPPIHVPAVLSLKAQAPTAASGLLRLLNPDETPSGGFWTSNYTLSNANGTEIIFEAPYAGAFAAGGKYEYITVDSSGNYLNRVVGTFGTADHRNQYTYTVQDQTVQTRTFLADGVNNYSAVETEDSLLQNNYLRQLLRTITEGATSARVIRNQQAYNAFGEVVSQTDGRGYTTHLSYNDLGNLIVQEQPETAVAPAEGSAQSRRPTTRYYYDELGQLIGTQDANSELLAARQKYYSTRVLVNGRVQTEFDANGYATRYSYDRLGDQRQKFDALNMETAYEYDKKGALTRVTRYDGAGVQHSFDTYEYDAAGNRIAHTNALNNRETYLYDGRNRIVVHTSFAGRLTSYAYTYSSAIGGIGGFETTTTTAGVTGLDTMVDRTDYFGRVRYHRDLGGHEFTYQYNQAGWLRRQTGTTADGGANQRDAQEILYEYYQNGLLKSVDDLGISSFARFQYDNNGNRTLETYSQVPITSGAQTRHPYQVATAEYDELNRVKRVLEAGKFDIRYTYDAVGNRRSVSSQYFDLLTNHNEQREYFYTYDRMNRFTITMGARDTQDADGDGNTQEIVRGNTGYEIEYDELGRRHRVSSDFLNPAGQAQHVTEEYTYDPIDTVREARIYNAGGFLVGRTLRENNALGELTDYREYDAVDIQTKYVHYDYDLDSLTVQEEDRTDNNRRERTAYTFAGNGILTATLGTTVNASGGQVANTPTVNLQYAYEKWDSYKESVVTVTATAPNVRGWRPGTSTYRYDSNGHIRHLYDSQAVRSIDYVNNHHGQVLKRYEIDHELGSDLPPVVRNFYYLNGIGIGDVGNDNVASRVDYAQSLAVQERNGRKVHQAIGDRVTPVTSADFDQNYQPINPGYPGRASTSHIVQTGETLQSIARAVWGDGSLWYLLAEANGLGGDEQLAAGLRLTVPNVVTNIHNNSQTFRPYDASLALGDTMPTLPAPPPPAQGKGCGALGMILIIVVAIVVTVFTAGVGATAAGASISTATGTVAAGSAAAGGVFGTGLAVLGGAGGLAGFGAAVVGGAVGAAASQGVAIAAGMQEGFDWKGVALGALGAGVGAGLGALANGSSALQQAVSTFANKNPHMFAALNGAASNALTQGLAVGTGLQSSFNWRNVAISSLAAPAAKAIGQGATRFAPALGSFGSKVASGIGGSLVRRALGSREDSATIIADAIGNAVGNSIVEGVPLSSSRELTPHERRMQSGDTYEHQKRLASGEYVPAAVSLPEFTLEPGNSSDVLANLAMPSAPILSDIPGTSSIANNPSASAAPVVAGSTALERLDLEGPGSEARRAYTGRGNRDVETGQYSSSVLSKKSLRKTQQDNFAADAQIKLLETDLYEDKLREYRSTGGAVGDDLFGASVGIDALAKHSGSLVGVIDKDGLNFELARSATAEATYASAWGRSDLGDIQIGVGSVAAAEIHAASVVKYSPDQGLKVDISGGGKLEAALFKGVIEGKTAEMDLGILNLTLEAKAEGHAVGIGGSAEGGFKTLETKPGVRAYLGAGLTPLFGGKVTVASSVSLAPRVVSAYDHAVDFANELHRKYITPLSK